MNQRWQSTGGGNEPVGGNQPAVTVEIVLPSATLQCSAVSNDSSRIKLHPSYQQKIRINIDCGAV